MEAWIGPVIIAASVSGIISAAGWWVTFRTSLRLEQMRREEKVHDFQVALRAEISSDLLNLEVADRAAMLAEIAERYTADPHYPVLVPHLASNVVFDAIVKDIHVLPGEVIAPVIHYAQLRQSISRFIDDLRAESAVMLPPDRRLLMFSDYFKMLDRLEALAQNAVATLDRSLKTNRPGVVQSTPGSASGPDGASAAKFEAP